MRAAIRLRAIKECPHWEMGNKMRYPCSECEVVAAIAEERERAAKIADEHFCAEDNRTEQACGLAIAAAIRGRT